MDIISRLETAITKEGIASLQLIDDNFDFVINGCYFFISPISGLINICFLGDLPRWKKSIYANSYNGNKLIFIIDYSLNNDDQGSIWFDLESNIDDLHRIQQKAIKLINEEKILIDRPGIYELTVLYDTVNYVNYWKNKDKNPYFLLNGIDSKLYNSNYDKVKDVSVLDFCNQVFSKFGYKLDGILIYKRFTNRILNVIKVQVNQKYKFCIDYRSRGPDMELVAIGIIENGHLYNWESWTTNHLRIN